jgi:hypothetical protein
LVLRKKYVIEGRRKLHSAVSQFITFNKYHWDYQIKENEMVGHIAYMNKMRNAYKILKAF